MKLSVGDRYQNLSGDAVEIVSLSPLVVECRGLKQLFTPDEIRSPPQP